MSFAAYDLSLELIRDLRESIAIVERRDADLSKHITSAIANVALCAAEASDVEGAERQLHVRCAIGSLRQTGAYLDVAVAFGWLTDSPVAEQRHRLAELLARLQWL